MPYPRDSAGRRIYARKRYTKRDREQINRMLEEGRTPPEEIADETHLRLDLVGRLAWLHEYSEDLEESERAHAASDRAKPDRENWILSARLCKPNTGLDALFAAYLWAIG